MWIVRPVSIDGGRGTIKLSLRISVSLGSSTVRPACRKVRRLIKLKRKRAIYDTGARALAFPIVPAPLTVKALVELRTSLLASCGARPLGHSTAKCCGWTSRERAAGVRARRSSTPNIWVSRVIRWRRPVIDCLISTCLWCYPPCSEVWLTCEYYNFIVRNKSWELSFGMQLCAFVYDSYGVERNSCILSC